jgi:hypothetical protein
MAPAVVGDFLPRPREHVRSQIYAGNIAMSRIGRKGSAGAGADFENLRARRDVQILDDLFEPTVENLAEDPIVERGELRVEFALVRLDVSYFPHPRQTSRC